MSTGIYVGLSSGNVGIGTGGINSVGSKLNVTGDMSAGFLIGQVSFFTMSTAPTGWLKCNGAAISRTTYAKLFAVIGTTYGVGDGSTTFNLPDLRGEFIRGWDDARAVDSGRTFGTAQTDALQNITGSVWAQTSGGPDKNILHSAAGAFSGFSQGNSIASSVATYGTNDRFSGINFNASLVVRTSTETRSRNIALLACIKY
jgi:microcystin-dependent protein